MIILSIMQINQISKKSNTNQMTNGKKMIIKNPNTNKTEIMVIKDNNNNKSFQHLWNHSQDNIVGTFNKKCIKDPSSNPIMITFNKENSLSNIKTILNIKENINKIVRPLIVIAKSLIIKIIKKKVLTIQTKNNINNLKNSPLNRKI